MAPPTAPVVKEITEEELEEDMANKLEHIKGLVVEFRGDNRSALERWLSELNVGWVVHLAPGTHESSGSVVASHGFQFLVQSWIMALRKIGESIFTSLDEWYSQSQRQDQDEGTSKQPSASEFAQLVQATVLKMLPFVDIAAAKTSHRPGAVAQKLQVLIDMHDAFSTASQHVLSLLSCYVQEECSDDKMRELLSADLTKLDEAIWDTVVEMRNNTMAWSWTDDGGSSDIHKVSDSIVSYTEVLWANCKSVNRILHDAVLRGEYDEPENENASYVFNLIMEMVSSLERKPSAKFPEESLRFLFLINNFDYLLQEFPIIWRLDFPLVLLTRKIDNYINSYLLVSWEPVLKCLHDAATPRCFTRYSFPLPKFESKFQKTYAAQKLWKVPDPGMRIRLRKAVIDKVIPVFTQFLEDNSIVTPGFTPRKLEKMLGELFEG
ncbi:exocyst complex component EXO70A1-like [Miscanthus floridulus]|uniref:exocyst complex component EXO70A1-like n=1 Tax=Miscanthus floridulus TaxID=154761 RepID=UPI00345B3E5A